MDTIFTLFTSGVVNEIYRWLQVNWDNTLSIIIGGVIVYYIGSLVLSRVVTRIVRTARRREWPKKDIEKRQTTLAALFNNVWRVIVVVIAGMSFFNLVFPDFNFAPLFASAGVIALTLGFGAQPLIKDLLYGIFIISENQYRVGDIVEIEGASGTVERISTRSTVIRDLDGNVHYLPNGMVTHVINKTMGYSVARFIIAVHPSSNIDKVAKIVNTLGEELAHEDEWRRKIIEPPSFVSIGEFTGTSLQIIIAGKTQPADQWSVTAEMRRRLLGAFEKAKIELSNDVAAPAPEPATKR